ncbi:hypothetical protein [Natrononativus amylolyticus]|uniref:hypothetical protein n=1 Tax=Natrononativus amylolyticus TaxID=2963434 RepID=UPI0020CD8E64|nr:hypothetical protein [Natrononativus amylolyticus]
MSDQRPIGTVLENRLMGEGVYVTDCERRGDDLVLEYEVVTETPAITSHEVGTVVRTVLAVADEREGWEPGGLEATSTTTDGAVRGTWRVEGDWFRRLHDDLSEVEFSERVLGTVDLAGDGQQVQ